MLFKVNLKFKIDFKIKIYSIGNFNIENVSDAEYMFK